VVLLCSVVLMLDMFACVRVISVSVYSCDNVVVCDTDASQNAAAPTNNAQSAPSNNTSEKSSNSASAR
jgi:hypothetical protein